MIFQKNYVTFDKELHDSDAGSPLPPPVPASLHDKSALGLIPFSGLKHNRRMVRLWCLAFSLFVFGANFNFAKADFEDLFDDDRIRDNFFGRDHEEFFDNIGRLIGKF